MLQPHHLSQREPLFFILFLVLMAVLLFGGRERRLAYDAEHGSPSQPKVGCASCTWDASEHDDLGPVPAPAQPPNG
jgi:hypothetical protein